MATKGVSDRLSREEFMNQLLTFMSERGSPIQRIPSLGGREKLWHEVIRILKLPQTATNAAFVLRLHYIHLLYALEMKLVRNIDIPVSDTPAPAVQIRRDRDQSYTKRTKTSRRKKRADGWGSEEESASSSGESQDDETVAGLLPEDREELGLRRVERKQYREADENVQIQEEIEETVFTYTNTKEELASVRQVGFVFDEVSQQELAAFPHLTTPERVLRYIHIRNFIVRTWRRRSTQHLPLSVVKERLVKHFGETEIEQVYSYLHYAGFINFGVLKHPMVSQLSRRKMVIIIGAGFAGMSAARQLDMFGFDTLIVEARARVGGRVCSDWRFGAPVDLGASIITGLEGNPVATVCRQLGVDLCTLTDHCPLYTPDGALVADDVDKRVEMHFNELLGNTKAVPGAGPLMSLGAAFDALQQHASVGKSPDEHRVLQWHYANLEFANAARLNEVSVTEWDQDDEYSFSGAHCMVRQGYGRVAMGMAAGLRIKFNAPVKEVRYAASHASVLLGSNEVLSGDAVLCTLPLGVLKRPKQGMGVEFVPPLPDWKTKAIDRLGFGLLNKVAIQFAEPFWDPETDFFGYTHDSENERGEFYWFWNLKRVNGVDALMALVSGESAFSIEEKSADEIVEKVVGVLSKIFGKIPPPVRAIATRWLADPYARGSYSFLATGSTGADYDTMARPIGRTLFFGGEATVRQYPATVHGAFFSGLRVAEIMADTLLHGGDAERWPSRPPLRRRGEDASADEEVDAQQTVHLRALQEGVQTVAAAAAMDT